MKHSKIETISTAGCVLALLTAGCSGAEDEPTDGMGHHDFALSMAGAGGATSEPGGAGGESTLELWLDAPPTAYVAAPTWIEASFFNPNSGSVVEDVTFTVRLSGEFDLSSYEVVTDDPFTCTESTPQPGTTTIDCHADQVQFWNAVMVEITPTVAGTVSAEAAVSISGTEVQRDARDIIVATADSADLSITGWGDWQTFVGEIGHASFEVMNEGPLPATGVEVSLDLTGPAEITSVGLPPWVAAAPPTCSISGTSAHCSIGALATSEYLPLEVSFLPTEPGEILISATVNGNEEDPNAGNDSTVAWCTVVVPTVADLAVAVTASKPAVVGRPLSYEITVTNQGPDAAGDAVLNASLPPEVTFAKFASSQGECFGGEWGFLDCMLGELAALGSATITVEVIPTVAGTITNTVSVSDWNAAVTDPELENNTAVSEVIAHGAGGATPIPPPGPPNKTSCGLWPGLPIEDLDDGDLLVGAHDLGEWFIFNDETGSQLPTSVEGLIVPGGPRNSRYMAHCSGSGFLDWGAGFGFGFGCAYDVSRFRGIRFHAQAGGMREFFMEVPTVELLAVEDGGECVEGCYDYYRTFVSLPDDGWHDCTVAFEDLQQAGWGIPVPFNRGAVTGAQFNFELWNLPYDLAVDDFEFVANPHLETACTPVRS